MRGCGLRIEEALAVKKKDFRDNGTILRVYQQATRDGRETVPLKKRKRGEYRDIPVPTWLWDMVKDLPDGPLMPGNGDRTYQLYGTVYERFMNAAKVAGIPAGFTPGGAGGRDDRAGGAAAGISSFGPVGAVLRAHRRRTVTAAAAAMAAGKLAGLLAATVGAGGLATVFLAALRPGRGAAGPGGHGQQLALPVLARLGGADQPGGDGAACPTGQWRRAPRLCWPPAGWPPAGWPGAALGLGSAVPSGIGGLLRGSTGAAVCARRERRGGGHPAVDLG
jgi:hypothetical protein